MLAYQAAIEGHGVAIAQKVLVEADVAARRLVAPYDFTLDMGAYTYYFVCPEDAPVSSALETFRNWLAACCSSDCKPSRLLTFCTWDHPEPRTGLRNARRDPASRSALAAP